MMYLESFPFLSDLTIYLRSQCRVVAEPHPVAAGLGLLSWCADDNYLIRGPSAYGSRDGDVEPEPLIQQVILIRDDRPDGHYTGELVEAAKRLAAFVDHDWWCDRYLSGPDIWPLSDTLGDPEHLIEDTGTQETKTCDRFFDDLCGGGSLWVEMQTYQSNPDYKGELTPSDALVNHLSRIRNQKSKTTVMWVPEAFEVMREVYCQAVLGGVTPVVCARRIRNVAGLLAVALNPEQPVVTVDIIAAATEPSLTAYQFVAKMFVGPPLPDELPEEA
jgi:hypothetical protein